MEKTLSLLPYLESGNNGIVLDIYVLRQDNSQGTSPPFPFQSAGPPKPFSRLIKGGLKCDGSNRVFQSVFILIQNDTCFSDTEAFSSQTNTTLDQAWLDTIQFFSKDPGTFTMTGPDHKAAQLKPLFYCRFKHRFFHPPCPECGGELVLCKDDPILKKAGLDSFHTGLTRYLFCPQCHASHSSHFFYAYAGQANDPAYVLDRHGLIKRFSNIKKAVPNGFPCADCPEHSACYLTGQNALSRIGCVSFYPFYMLVFNACEMTGTQFLKRLSNDTASAEPPPQSLPRSPNTVQLSGHGSSSYLFKDDPRFWLEILFLKYAFFKKVLTSVEKRLTGQVTPIYNLNLDSIWITTKSDAGMMPFFWDYELHLLDLVTTRPLNLFQTSMADNRHTNFIAQLCLYIFFVNHEHDANTVFQAGAALLQSTGENQWTNNAQAFFESHPMFKPENIFWHPAPVSMADEWHGLWIRTIQFAGSLIKKKESLDFPGFIRTCIRQVNDIQKTVKSELFSKDLQIKTGPGLPGAGANEQPPAQTATDTAQEDGQNNQAIAAILKRLKSKWENQAPPEPDEDEDIMETVVLSSSTGIKQPSDILPTKRMDTADQNEFEQRQETVVLGTQVPPDPPPSDFEDIQETVVLNTAPTPQTPEPEKEFEDMEETVILSSGTGLPSNGISNNSGDFFSEDDDFDKTVILPPKK
nr:hypothetical protein [uncultured Desulfobacter sp.]